MLGGVWDKLKDHRISKTEFCQEDVHVKKGNKAKDSQSQYLNQTKNMYSMPSVHMCNVFCSVMNPYFALLSPLCIQYYAAQAMK